MVNKKSILCIWLLFLSSLTLLDCFAQENDGIGQTIQIYTHFDSFIGKPSWLLIIRDLDHDQNIPYLYNITKGDNFWLAFTYGRNYLITVSSLQFSPYRTNPYQSKKIDNFCHLESNGRILRGESLYITIMGDLTPYTNTFTCHITRYPDGNFTIVKPAESE